MDEVSLALIVEDDPDLAEIFSAALTLAGFSVEAIGNGVDALARLQSIEPSVIVLDMHLPGISGIEILRQVREDPRLSSARVIASTADARLAETLEEKADLVLVKPVSFNQLRDLALRLKRRDK
ncbi:MAG TPA: response regulator [Anaerolineales bacterium]|nr:response regulator [Anaerolineales bacterium]